MAKLILMQGLPASGKSTKAAELLKEYGNAVRLNRDLLRTMLHCDVWSGPREKLTRDAVRMLAMRFLTHKTVGVVIVDDTNLRTGTVAMWEQLAGECDASCEIVRMGTPMEECLRRDALREKPVGRHVIVGMALQHGLYPAPAKGIVLCDIDGTIADCTHRRHFVQKEPKNWQEFFDAMTGDSVRRDILRQVNELYAAGHHVLFVSGRPETHRHETEGWLHWQCDLKQPIVFMRRAGDHRSDVEVKQEMLDTYFHQREWITHVFDDRPSVINGVWRPAGLNVIDCGDGTEF